MTKKDKFVLFWVYGDADDTPYIIRNPPRNLKSLLKQWNKLDREVMRGGYPPDWDYVNIWLQKKGVDIFAADREIKLEDV